MDLAQSQYEAECHCQFGISNPQRMRVATWEWMIRNGFTASGGSHHFRKEWEMPVSPRWCFVRYGMSQTVMSDGRIICIGGEHEDFYDCDFQIYNDVVVLRPAPGEADITEASGEIEIYGYPESVFQPTDSHSATLVANRIIIIGSIGYIDARVPGTTPVYALDTTTYRIERLTTHGACPGWIFKHHAAYDSATDSIIVRGGRVEVRSDAPAAFNSAAYRLRLADMGWEVVKPYEKTQRVCLYAVDYWDNILSPSNRTFRPRNVAHTYIPSDRPHPYNGPSSDYTIAVEGIRVTFTNWFTEVHATIEGELSPTTEHQLIADIIENLERETGVPWMSEYVESFKY